MLLHEEIGEAKFNLDLRMVPFDSQRFAFIYVRRRSYVRKLEIERIKLRTQ